MIPLRHSEHGSCVAKNTHSLVSGRSSAGILKNCWIQLISPCSNGDSRSLLVSASTGASVSRFKIAAPNSFEPRETCARVSGMIDSLVVVRRAVARDAADGAAVVMLAVDG